VGYVSPDFITEAEAAELIGGAEWVIEHVSPSF
jgi:hypothetical protein